MSKDFTEIAIDFGEKVYSHFKDHPYPTRLIETMFRGVSDDRALWKPLVESKEYLKLIKMALEQSKYNQPEIEDLLQEYMYDVGVNLHKRLDINHEREIRNKAAMLVDDIVERKPPYVALAPVFQFHCNSGPIDLESCILRPAKYTERIWYKPIYPLLVHPYGPEGFDYIIDLEREDNLKRIENGLADSYMQICSSVVAAIRLVCGGTAGLEFLTARNHFERIDLEHREAPGATYPMHYIAQGTERVWRSGKFPSLLSIDSLTAFQFIFNALSAMKSQEGGFIWRAIRRFCGSTESGLRLDDSILDIVIAFESLLGDDKAKASRRAATILSFNEGYNKKFANALESLWRARNSIAHGESLEEAKKRVKGNLDTRLNFAFYCLKTCLLISIAMKPINLKTFRKEIDKASKAEIPKADLFRNIPNEVLEIAGKGVQSAEKRLARL